jgi:hypothetical protein
MPFSTRLLAEYAGYRTALIIYWANILLLGAALYVSWICATRSRLVKDDMPADVSAAICRRIVIGQALYAFGALLCVFNTTGVLLLLCSSNCIMRLGRIFPGVLAARYHLVNVEIVRRVSRPASKSVALQRWHRLTLGPLHRVGAPLPWSDRPRQQSRVLDPTWLQSYQP